MTEDDLALVTQSYHAYFQSKHASYEDERKANLVNGEVVTDSESDNPEEYIEISDLVSENGNKLIGCHQKACTEMHARVIAEQNFLSRRVSKRVSRILAECSDIKKVIEKTMLKIIMLVLIAGDVLVF